MRKTALFLSLAALVMCGAAGSRAAQNPYEDRASPVSESELDKLVLRQLDALKLPPAALCSDAVFVRRVYLDAIGTLPSGHEAKEFLLDTNPRKRAALIDRLLERDEFADYCAMKWSDILRVKAEFPVNLWPNAAQAYHRWIRTSLKENKPYNVFARELLTANGSNFRDPPVNFYRAMQNRDPQGIAQTVALTFMGTRADKWPTNRLAGLAAFFSEIGYKQTGEWKEEIVFFDPDSTNAVTCATLPDGKQIKIPAGKDPREVFSDWLITSKNPWFARAAVNRVWSWLLGRGIIVEPDDLRPDNPPVNPKLLAYLESEFTSSNYALKTLYRLILNSQTYQRSSLPKSSDPRAVANFASYPLRRLDAEVMIDALNQITGTTEKYTSAIPEPFTFIPEDERSIALPDGSITSPFLELFGRPARDTGLETERNSRITAAQCLHLLNSSHVQRKIQDCRMVQYLSSRASQRETVDGLYLGILSRFPTEAEFQIATDYSKSGGLKSRDGTADLAWALINTSEFLYRH